MDTRVTILRPQIVAILAGLFLSVAGSLPAQAQWGLEFGAGHHDQEGSFKAPCGCTFDGGSGNGFVGALSFALPEVFGFSVGVKAGVDFKKTFGAHDWTSNNGTVMTGSGALQTVGELTTRDNMNVSTTYLTFEPYARYKLFGTGIFLQAGAGAYVLAASHYLQERQIVSAITGEQTVSNPRFADGTSTLKLEDGSIPDIRSMRYSALLSAGYDFGLLGFRIAPMITYDVPLSEIRSVDASSWRVSSLYGSVAFMFSP